MSEATDQNDVQAYDGCSIPPQVYDIGFGWGPRPEIDRLAFLAREAGATVRSALELGCGTGRLLAAFGEEVLLVRGIELNPDMAELGRRRLVAKLGDEPKVDAAIVTGDMTDFDLGRRFDLIYTSANTIRHIAEDDAIARMWRSVAEHLAPGGVFVADLELGIEYEAGQAGKPAKWLLSRGAQTVHVTWEVVDPPDSVRRRTGIRWAFELRAGGSVQRWEQRFELRAFDACEFVALAERSGLGLAGLYELRDPYLLERPADRFAGRGLVVLKAGLQ